MTAVVHPGAYLTNTALFLDVDELAVNPAAAPAPAPAVVLAAPAVVAVNNNGFGSSIVTNTNTLPAGARMRTEILTSWRSEITSSRLVGLMIRC